MLLRNRKPIYKHTPSSLYLCCTHIVVYNTDYMIFPDLTSALQKKEKPGAYRARFFVLRSGAVRFMGARKCYHLRIRKDQIRPLLKAVKLSTFPRPFSQPPPPPGADGIPAPSGILLVRHPALYLEQLIVQTVAEIIPASVLAGVGTLS